MDLAVSTKTSLLRFVEGIASFASANCRKRHAVTFSVDVKDPHVASRKAYQKYQGDILLVKDILRARLSFPDEGSLVCGLSYLFKNTKIQHGEDDAGSSIALTRIKNLFYRQVPQQCLSPSPLPTGYRHVLVNVRLENGLLAGRSLHIYCFLLTYLIYCSIMKCRNPVQHSYTVQCPWRRWCVASS